MAVYNLRDVDEASYEAIPAGIYRVTVADASMKETGEDSKVPNSPMMTLELRVDGGEYENKPLWHNMVFHEKTLPFVKRDLRALGFTDDELEEFDPQEACSDIEGRECDAVVGVRQYQGEPTNNIRRLRALDAEEAVLP